MDEEAVLEIVARHASREGPLLPILHDLQDEHGFIAAAAVPILAEALNLSRAEVHGVIGFYHDFRREPATRPVIRLCRAEACQARGVDQVAGALEAVAGVDVETVYCLGLCASGPSAMIGRRVFARLDEASVDRLVLEAGR